MGLAHCLAGRCTCCSRCHLLWGWAVGGWNWWSTDFFVEKTVVLCKRSLREVGVGETRGEGVGANYWISGGVHLYFVTCRVDTIFVCILFRDFLRVT